MTILRHVANGVADPAKVSELEPEISSAALTERLRTITRYKLVARVSRARPSLGTEYRLTSRGKKIMTVIDILDQLDSERPEAEALQTQNHLPHSR